MKTAVKALVIGESGSGKSFFSGTFPKSYVISTEPNGWETVEMRPELRANTVKQAYFIPSPIYDSKQVFADIDAACKEAHQMYAKGEIETLVLDNMTYLSENRWLHINQYEKEISAKTGNIDTQAMYGKLGRWLYQFTLMNLCSFPGNVVVTSHIKQESEQAMEKKLGDDSVVSDILGGFRNQAPGMFSIVMFLTKEYKNKLNPALGYQYRAILNKTKDRLAKNRYNLPDTVEDISYQTILNEIIKAKGQQQ